MMMEIDWNAQWKEYGKIDRRNSSTEYWDSRAPRFRKKKDGPDIYVEEFYRLMEPEPGDTFFDMGCGSGTLALPFAQKGHHVWAADFSPAMLECLMKDAEAEGLADRIHPVRLDWNEDWSARNLPKCDIAFASRSLIFEDLTRALKNLESVAVRRCCVGAWDTPVMDYDRHLAKAIGYERPGPGVNRFVMNELMDRDMFPEQIFIRSPFRNTKFRTYEEGVEKLKSTFLHGLTRDQERLLEEYCREHLKYHIVEDGGEKGSRGDAQGEREFWQMDHSDISTMAFIRWNL